MKSVSSTSELKIFWNNFQKDYMNHMEPNVLNLFMMLFNSSNIFKINEITSGRKTILEAACGAGAGLEYLCWQLNQKEIEADVYGTDLSPNMLEATYNRMKKLNYINLDYLDSQMEKTKNSAKINLFLKEADNENLPFEENRFDLIISSLSLHLVADPEKMLFEVKRILKPEAFAYFSIWGRPENCLPFTVIPNNLKKANIVLPNNRSNFHLSKEETLKELFNKAGISKYKISTTFVPFNFIDAKDFLFMMNGPSFSEMLKNCSDKEKENIKDNIINDLNEVINGEKFLGIEAFLIRTAKF